MGELKLIRFVEFFLNNPYEEIYIRKLARRLSISPFATKKYADTILKEGVIIEERRANLRYLRANTNNLFYKYLKISYNLRQLLKAGIVSFIKDNVSNITAVILFGSLAKGENDDKSDIDVVIIGKQKYLNLHDFEAKLKREITLHFFSWSEWNEKAKEDHPFYYEVISYGIPLYGELPLTKWK